MMPTKTAFAMSLKFLAARIVRLAIMTQMRRTTMALARMRMLVSIAMATVWLIQTKTRSATKMKSLAVKTLLLATTTPRPQTLATAIIPKRIMTAQEIA